MTDPAIALVKRAKQRADQSVDYSPRYGAVCPVCGAANLKVITSRPWEDNIKVRFHKCRNRECLLYWKGTSIKSVQIDEIKKLDCL